MSEPAPSPTRIAPLALWRVAQAFLHTLYALFGAPEEVAAQHTLTAKAHEALALWLRCAEALLRRLILIEASAYEKPNTRPLLRPVRPRARRAAAFDAERPDSWRVSFRCFSSPVYGGSVGARRAMTMGARQAQLSDAGVAGAPSGRCAAPSPARGGGNDLAGEPVFVFCDDRQPPPPGASKPRRSDSRQARSAQRGARILRQARLWVAHEPKLRFRASRPLAERYEACLRVFNDPAPYARRLARRLHAEPHRLAEALHAPAEAHDRVDRFEALTQQAEWAWRPRFSSA